VYYRTYTNTGAGATGEADPATISGFRLDKYLVTVGRFRQFVTAWNNGAGWLPVGGTGKHTHLNGGNGLANSGAEGGYEPGWVVADDSNLAPTNANLGWCNINSAWTNTAGTQESLPMNCVTWQEAYAFCIWDGGFLPSEAEWEFAAAGGSEQLEYPWGSAPPGTASDYAVYGDEEGNCYYPSGLSPCTGVVNLAPVGMARDGMAQWGQLDMAGDVWEWNLDWYAPYTDICTDCADTTAATFRVDRGASFYDSLGYLLPPCRDWFPPASRDALVGFRCARTP
jgi:formylglycine-generating enzyme required for sulfatase activity